MIYTNLQPKQPCQNQRLILTKWSLSSLCNCCSSLSSSVHYYIIPVILFYYLLALLWVWVYMSSHVIAIDIDVYSVFAVIFNTLCLEVVYDSMRLFHWYLHYIYDLILYLCIMYYTVCYLTGIFYAVVRQISMLFIDNKISVFCTPHSQQHC